EMVRDPKKQLGGPSKKSEGLVGTLKNQENYRINQEAIRRI
ncbi:unnamed protein product, partial [marine sediment metagenome]